MGSLKGQKVLITGGNGYIGRFLIEILIAEMANVYVLDICTAERINLKVKYFTIDLLNYNELKRVVSEIEPNVVFHLAASLKRIRTYDIIDEIIEINLKATNNLLKALVNINYSSFIFLSTSEVYGIDNKSPFNEDMKLNPASPYSLSKAAAELSIQTYSSIYNKPYTILRLFNLYGPDMPQSFFISQLINVIIKGDELDMTKGEQKRDYIYIDDVVKSILFLATISDQKAIYNLCSGVGISLKDIANELVERINKKTKINFGAMPYRKNEIWNLTGDNSKIAEILPFIIKANIFENLNNLILLKHE